MSILYKLRRTTAVIIAIVFCCLNAIGQVDEAKQAISDGDYVRAVTLLSGALADHPDADTYLYLGVAYANLKDYNKAEDTLKEGASRFGEDPRFHNELAGVYLNKREVETAKAELEKSLGLDPHNNYASDLLASIDISQGEVQEALKFWNKSGRPVIQDIMHNYYLNFGSWVVRDSIAFHPGSMLRYNQWKTTEARLWGTNGYSNVGLEVEPTVVPEQYTAVVRTTSKINSRDGVLFDLLKGAPIYTSYFDLWNLGNTGINWNSQYRWDPNRRRLDGVLQVPLPAPGSLHMELADTWRAEHWDLSPIIRQQFQPQARFDYRANHIRIALRDIPNYRVEFGGGLDYANRDAKGDLPQIATDGRNSGKFFANTTLRFADGGSYQDRLNVEAFWARKSILGDLNYSGGTAELNNRLTLSKDTRTYFDWTAKTGTSRGSVPVEDYFALGLDTYSTNLLRGHSLTRSGHYGSGPMGTDFVLFNFDVERHLVTVPLFNTFNLPFIVIKPEVFLDAGKTWDRQRIFQEGKLLVDTGASLRFEIPSTSFVAGYGRSLRDGRGVLFLYIEPKLW